MNAAASDRRNIILENAFSGKEYDLVMERLYEEIMGAKYEIIDSKFKVTAGF